MPLGGVYNPFIHFFACLVEVQGLFQNNIYGFNLDIENRINSKNFPLGVAYLFKILKIRPNMISAKFQSYPSKLVVLFN